MTTPRILWLRRGVGAWAEGARSGWALYQGVCRDCGFMQRVGARRLLAVTSSGHEPDNNLPLFSKALVKPITPSRRHISATGLPRPSSTSACRSLFTMSSAEWRFLDMPRSSFIHARDDRSGRIGFWGEGQWRRHMACKCRSRRHLHNLPKAWKAAALPAELRHRVTGSPRQGHDSEAWQRARDGLPGVESGLALPISPS